MTTSQRGALRPQNSETVMPDTPLLRVENVVKHFPVRRGLLARRQDVVHAVDNISFDVARGETLGFVGESGCGKSTLARCLVGLHPVTSGQIFFDGEDIAGLSGARAKAFRRNVQMIFQDPYGSLNPRRRVGSIIGDPFAVHNIVAGAERQSRVKDLMERVGLNPEHYNRFPAEFSGGQRQRIGVARALALKPRLIICDEPVSALDVSIQAQIINLLRDLQAEFKLTYVFIGHDLSVIEHVSDRVAVMYLGRLAEVSPADEFFRGPRHPYSSALLSATMVPDPKATQRRGTAVLAGDVPSPLNPPSGCRFHTRCPRAADVCAIDVPPLEACLDDPPTHLTACHFPLRGDEHLDPVLMAGSEPGT